MKQKHAVERLRTEYFAGGKIKVRVVSKGLHLRYPNTRIELWGKDLHAPMAERVLELPFDVYEGIPHTTFYLSLPLSASTVTLQVILCTLNTRCILLEVLILKSWVVGKIWAYPT